MAKESPDSGKPRIGRRTALALGAATLAGTSVSAAAVAAERLALPYALNYSLYYLPWPQLMAGLSDTARASIRALGDDPASVSSRNTVTLVPGMILRLHDAFLFERGTNTFVPAMSQYDWVIPSVTLGRRDWFFLSVFLAAAEPEARNGKSDPVEDFRRGLSSAAKGNQNPDKAVIDQVLNALKTAELVNEREGSPSSQPGTASRVREWLAIPSFTDLDRPSDRVAPGSRQLLRMRLPLGDANGKSTPVLLRAFHSAGGFHLDSAPALVPDLEKKNAWYADTQVFSRRCHLEASAMVQFQGAGGFTAVPLYTSVRDLEREYSRGIICVRRRPQFLRSLRTDQGHDIDITGFVSKTDGRAALWFNDLPRSFDGESVLTVGAMTRAELEALKGDIVIAPDDVILFNAIGPY